ncbi:hypothetical protein MferCBS31731_004991 [Microsporum ferrugineum]
MALPFEANGLYVLLSDRGDLWTFHWGLYLANTKDNGTVYHLVNPPNSNDWMYEAKQSNNVQNSNRLLVALKVGIVEPLLHEMLGQCLSEVPIQYSTRFHENITCRVWLKEALYELNERGLLNITKSVDSIEEEAKGAAMINKSSMAKSVIKSTITSP